ncbi:GyrI-like domain-containing protein, partial [Thomasclavelia cocleata]|uniref:GyrI-like domain-containing protein n=1 Tax=Thomasclavelia cocleata TaxID=69824 RepID=UPI00256EA927
HPNIFQVTIREKNQNTIINYEEIEEGKCVQIMHIGSYDSEVTSIKKIYDFIDENGLEIDINDCRLHHEIYLSDPRKTKVENLKTVIRYPVK